MLTEIGHNYDIHEEFDTNTKPFYHNDSVPIQMSIIPQKTHPISTLSSESGQIIDNDASFVNFNVGSTDQDRYGNAQVWSIVNNSTVNDDNNDSNDNNDSSQFSTDDFDNNDTLMSFQFDLRFDGNEDDEGDGNDSFNHGFQYGF
jgi:hypothetical protein